jgi:hypothetical protein
MNLDDPRLKSALAAIKALVSGRTCRAAKSGYGGACLPHRRLLGYCLASTATVLPPLATERLRKSPPRF